jgi:heptosyltransferase-2
MVWHLPHIHSLAALADQGKVSILTKPRSRADVLLAGDPCVDKILWLERNPGKHDGLRGFFQLVAELRRDAFQSVWILHDSNRYAWAAFLAGIPERKGYGQGIQHLLLTQPIQLQPEQLKLLPIELGDLLLKHYGIDKVEDEPVLPVYNLARQRMEAIYGAIPKPRIALGIGSSEAFKQWGEKRFTELVIALGKRFDHALILIGGPGEQEMAKAILSAAEQAGVRLHPATGLPIDDTAAVLAECDLYVGNDTGFLNMAAALAVPSIGLFGGSPPLTHSRYLHCLLPEDPASGMSGITAEQVIKQAQRLNLLP